MMSSPLISEARFNSGVNSLMNEEDIINRLKVIETLYKKKIWIDLKGRQLRVNAWADPSYEAIELNHDIELEYPAKVIFRGSNESEILFLNCKPNLIELSKESLSKLSDSIL